MLATALTDAGFEVRGQPPFEIPEMRDAEGIAVTALRDPSEEELARLVEVLSGVATRIVKTWDPPGGVSIPIWRRRGDAIADLLAEATAD
jgi:hypothetical protein